MLNFCKIDFFTLFSVSFTFSEFQIYHGSPSVFVFFVVLNLVNDDLKTGVHVFLKNFWNANLSKFLFSS